jgi:hypothetical protein
LITNYRQVEHDLYWGHRLYLLRYLHQAYGFRGNAKGQGFRGYLEGERIPPRKAYRLIKRYLRMKRIWDRVCVANETLEAELFPPPLPETLAQLADVSPQRYRDDG